MSRTWMIAVFALTASGCATPRHLARVNDDLVDGQDLKDEFVRRHGGHQRFLASDDYIVRKFLDATIDRRLLLQEAYRLGIQDEPDIRAAVAETLQKKQAEHFIRAEIHARAEVTGAEIDAVYASSHVTSIYLVREIVVPTREEAEGLVTRLAAGADFEGLARERSTADSRKFGGLAEVAWGSRSPEWEEAVFPLEVGEIAGPLDVGSGFQLVKMERRREAEKPAFAKAAARIRTILSQRKLETRRREVLGALRTEYDVKLLDFDPTVAALRAAKEAKDPRPIATWTGGALSLGAFAATLDLDAVAKLPAGRIPEGLDRERDSSVSAALVDAEAATRGYEALPEIARAVRDRREALMENRLYGEHVFREVTVTEEDLRAHHAAHPEEFTVPERRHVAHVVLETEEEARAVKEELSKGGSFIEVAKARSKDPELARTGGDLGWIGRKEAVGELAPIFEVGAGELVGPVGTKFGWHVIKVLEIAPPRLQPLEEVAADVRKQVQRKKNQEQRDAWVKKLRADADVSISDRAVRAFVRQGQAELDEAGGLVAKPATPSRGGASGHGGMGGGAPGHRGMGGGRGAGPVDEEKPR